jgi:putative hydrolase of the HAD superfamily
VQTVRAKDSAKLVFGFDWYAIHFHSMPNDIMPITTIIFDVDDTLYDVSTGFTAHRNGYGAQSFMVAKLCFPSLESAKVVRDEYFERYHSTAKALTVAQAEGRLPPEAPPFDAKDLAEWWAEKLDFSLLGGINSQLQLDLSDLQLITVAFSNGPRKYVKRVLLELGVWDFFGEERLYAVDDVLPYCKPEREAFEVIFSKLGVKAEECVIVEDSMKNIRKAKELGVKTVLVKGRPSEQTTAAEATKPGDAPIESDPSVDVVIEDINQLRAAMPGLWGSRPVKFEPVQQLINWRDF